MPESLYGQQHKDPSSPTAKPNLESGSAAVDATMLEQQPRFRPPVFVDLIHNNARSRVLLLVLFAFVTAIVTFYFTSTVFATTTLSTVRIVYGTSPPLTATFGARFTNFSAVVTNQWGLGIAGVEVTVTFFPLNTFTLGVDGPSTAAASLHQSDSRGRAVDCVGAFLQPGSATAHEDALLCNIAAIPGAVSGNVAITNADGVAMFDNLRVFFGAPVTYAVIATHGRKQVLGDTNSNFVEASVTMQSPITHVMVANDSTVVLPSMLRVGETLPELDFEVSLEPSAAERDPIGSFLNFADEPRQNDGARNSTLELDSLLCAMFSHGSATHDRLLLSRNVARVQNVTIAQREGSALTFKGRLRFATTTLQGVLKTSQVATSRVLVWCLGVGVVVPVAPPEVVATAAAAFSAITGAPLNEDASKALSWGIHVNTTVKEVHALAVINSWAETAGHEQGNVPPVLPSTSDGSVLPPIYVQVLDAARAPAGAGTRCVIKPKLVAPLAGSAPPLPPKLLANAVSNVSGADGVCAFSSTMFTAAGAPGTYALTISCDGVAATRVGTATTKDAGAWNGTVNGSVFLVNITSSVSEMRIVVLDSMPEWISNDTLRRVVTLGELWPTAPTARIATPDGGVQRAVGGKRPHLRVDPNSAATMNITSLHIVFDPVETDSGGRSTFAAIRIVALARTPTAQQLPADALLPLSFILSVDGVDAPTRVERLVRLRAPGEQGRCSAVDASTTGLRVTSGAPLREAFAGPIVVRDVYGTPVASDVPVELRLVGEFGGDLEQESQPCPPGRHRLSGVAGATPTPTAAACGMTLLTGVGGVLDVSVVAIIGASFEEDTPVAIALRCADSPLSGAASTAFTTTLLLAPRFTPAEFDVGSGVMNSDSLSTVIHLLPSVAEQVPGRVHVTLEVVSQPFQFTEGLLPPLAFPKSEVPAVLLSTPTSTAPIEVTVNVTMQVRPPVGFFVFRLVVDGAPTNHLLTLSLDSGVRRLQLLSASLGPASALRFYTELPQQPVVACQAESGDPVVGTVLFAAMVVVDESGDGPAPRVLMPNTNARDFELAMLSRFRPDDEVQPVSQPSNATGAAHFDALGILGASASGEWSFRLRYCAHLHLCVEESISINATMAVAAGSPPLVQLLSLPSLYAVPGFPLPSGISASIFSPSTSAAPLISPIMWARARLVVFNRSAEAPLLSQQATQTVISEASSPGVVSFTNVAFAASTPLGYYQLQVAVPGGRSAASTAVAVTRSAFSMDIVGPPPAQAMVGAVLPVVVRVRLPDGQPLPSALVRATLRGDDANCVAQQCGGLRGGSATAFTNASGLASFQLMVDAAGAGFYRIRFAVEGSSSSIVDKLNGFIGGVDQFAFAANFLTTSSLNFLGSQDLDGDFLLAQAQMFAENAVEGSMLEGSLPPIPENLGDGVMSELEQQQQQGQQQVGVANTAVAAASRSSAAAAVGVSSFLQARLQREMQGSALLSLASSAAYRRLREASEISAESAPIRLWNAVHNVTILEQPELQLAGFSGSVSLRRMPVVRALDSSGAPMANRSVSIHVIPSTIELRFSAALAITDEQGLCRFVDLRITNAAPGEYQLVFLIDGVASPRSELLIIGAQDVSQSVLVQVLALIVLLILSPLFFASMPYASRGFFFASFAVLVAVPALGFEWALVNVIQNDNVFLRLHIGMLSLLWIVVTISCLVLLGFETLSRKFWTIRVFDGEDRMLHAYRYTKWLLNVRRPQLSEQEWKDKLEAERRKSCKGRLGAAMEWAIPSKSSTIDLLFGTNKAVNIYEIRRFEPPPLEIPSDIRPLQFPNRFLIVLSITVVLMIVTSFLAVHIQWNIMGFLDELRGMLPRPPDASVEEKQQINSELQSAVIVGFNLVADVNPQLEFLKSLEGTIQKIDIFSLWESSFLVIDEVRGVVQFAGNFGLGCGVAAVMVTWVTLCVAVNQIMWKIHRGELRSMKPSCSLIMADRYVGLHVMHFIITFLSVFFIGFIVALVLSSRRILLLIVLEYWLAILTSLVSVILTTIMELGVVGHWWVTDLTIKLMYPYFIWTVVSIVLSLVNGIIQTLVRWFKAIFSITVLFARLDYDIFPDALLFLDSGYWAFYSMLFVHEEYNNPIFLSAVGVFMTELLVQREFTKDVQTPFEHFGKGTIALPHIANITRIHLRDRCGEPLSLREAPSQELYPWDLHLQDAKRRRYRRAAARWRLATLLLLNPRLQLYRKQRVVPMLAGGDDAAAALKPCELREQQRRRHTLTLMEAKTDVDEFGAAEPSSRGGGEARRDLKGPQDFVRAFGSFVGRLRFGQSGSGEKEDCTTRDGNAKESADSSPNAGRSSDRVGPSSSGAHLKEDVDIESV